MESSSLRQLGIIGIFSPKLLIPFKPLKQNSNSSQICLSASKWADRLISDFHFSPDSQTPHSPKAATLSPPQPQQTRSVSVPIDFYRVLGAETHFLADGIKRACDAKLSKPPQYGFSQDVLIARRVILQAACDTLANGSSRIEYNRGLAEDEGDTLLTQVPWDKVPGALCVLQEAGETEVVLQIGESLLRERLPKSFKQDIVLVMALAYVDMSREAMALLPPDFIGGCELLERALKLLQEEGASSLAPDLQAQIDETLEEITPRCVLELLSLPLDAEFRTRREEGLRGVRNILWAVGGGGAAAIAGGFTREKFMNEAFLRMTASEQVDLFVATPSNIPAESFEVYGVALALVAQAFLGKKPHLIQDANNLFQQLQQTRVTSIENAVSVYSPSENREVDFALERGLCSLLVGELEQCRSWLGLDIDNSPYRNPSVVSFILENSQGDDENDLPGLCKLLETWLVEVVFPRFRDTANIQFKLRDYYDDPKVLRYLENLEGVGSSPLAAAAAIVKIGAEATAVLDSVKANALQALQRVFPLGHKENDESNYYVPFFGNGEPLENPDQEEISKIDEMSRNRDYSDLSDENLITNRIKDSTVKIMCAGVVVGAMTLFGLKLVPARNGATTSQKEVGTAVTSDVLSNEFTTEDRLEEQPRMDSRYAEGVVRKWQDIKSQALGFDHITGKLPEILDGQMLKIWADRAAEVAQRGWYWDFTLLNLAIDNVTLSKDGQRAVVEATLTESARLNGVDSVEHKDSYARTYTARYVMICTKMGWKISEGAVLESLDVDSNELLV